MPNMSTRTVSINNSAPRAGLVKMPTYTIQEDAPWMTDRPPSAVSSSVYSDTPTMQDGEGSPRSLKAAPYTIHETHIPDHGPQTTRQTRLPIFNQVRTMLSKSNASSKEDVRPSEPAHAGKKAALKPSKWDGVFDTRRYSPGLKSLKSKKNDSSISISRDSDASSIASGRSTSAHDSSARSSAPTQISVNAVSQLPRGVSAKSQVKRKPVMSLSPSATENFAPQDMLTVPDANPHSRFSWSTAAPSEAPKRLSTDTAATGAGRPPLVSHFSWTTIGTSAAPTPNEELDDPTSPPPMPSPKPEHAKFSDTPTESILSRKRPVRRADAEDYVPSTPRQRADTTGSSDDSTPRATPRARVLSFGEQTPTKAPSASNTATPTSTATSSAKKALPLPPFMTSTQASHLELLVTQEKNLTMQRQNIERAISDLEKVERASPLEVPFAAVRDAKRRLDERRETLREVKMEEMDIGIRIARARRKEDFGEGEGTLWVRRVTG